MFASDRSLGSFYLEQAFAVADLNDRLWSGAAATASLSRSGVEVVARLDRKDTDPAHPLTRLFVVGDLRQLRKHRKRDLDAGLERALARLGVDARAAEGSWGAVLDKVQVFAILYLMALNGTLSQALANMEAH